MAQMHEESLPSGTVTFLFTDIEGSTKLSQEYSDDMPRLLARHHAMLNEAIAAYNGFTFQIVGDSYAVAFHNASDALNAALDSQRALHQEPWSPAPIKVRMGVHTGTAQLQPAGSVPRYDAYATIAQSQRIMSVGHGGQILLSQTSADLVRDKLPTGIRLVDMRERRLKDIASPIHLYQISAPDLPCEFAPLTSAEQFNHNLPSELTPFLGREMELKALETLLGESHNRLVTIIAQGGMGKTRLALHVATQLLQTFPQGVYFVALDRINSAELIVQSVAAVLPISLASNEDPKLRVLDYLRDKSILLVMDNFEHLLVNQDSRKLSNNFEHVPDGATFVQEMLTAAPSVQILATSRLRLNLTSETVFNIGGLTIGAPAVAQNSAIQLFVQSAKRTRPDFELNDTTLPSVTRICQLVEGMPLAIVLAAAWINTLTVKEICDEIEASLDMLETEQRDVPSRQRSVRVVIESSWNQIDATAQKQMMRLSVFRGGFTRAAAQETVGASLRSLSQLVDKALLRRDPDTARYSMHELLRQYAQELLDRSASEDRDAHESHAKFFADFMQARWKDIRGEQQIAALGEMEADIDNIRIAWNHWIANQDVRRAMEFLDPLWFYFEVHSALIPAIQLFDAAIKQLTSEATEIVCLRAQIRSRQAWFIGVIGQPEEGLQIAMESVEVLREQKQVLNVQSLLSVCVSAIYLNKWQEYVEASREMVAWAEQHGDTFERCFASLWWSYTFLPGNQSSDAVQIAQQALDVGKRLDNPFLLTWAEYELGIISALLGEIGAAKTHYMRGAEQAQRIKFARLLQINYEPLSSLALIENDSEQAENYALECLRISQQCGQTREMLASLRDLARVNIVQGKLEIALALLAVVLYHPASEQNSLTRPEALRDEAEKLRTDIEAQLDPLVYRAAWEAGQKSELPEVVSQILNHGSVLSPLTW